MTNTANHIGIPVDLKGLTPQEIERFCAEELGQKAGQGTRVAVWLFRKTVEDIDSMEDLGKSFRKLLKECCTISSLTVEQQTTSEDGTIKLLYGLEDGNAVEGVLIPGSGRLTLCISSQVGCASGCGFCRTGEGGFIRNLTTAEMVNQFFSARKHGGGKQISNIVLMGTGEPLNNYENVKSFVEIAANRFGLGFSGKKITLSTCGLAPMIEKMAEEMDVSLAVSLSATTDNVRDRIMPINKAYPIARLMQALRYYCDRTGRSVTIEYVLFKDINDSDEDAERLMELLKGLPCMVNVLTFNPFPDAAFERPDEERTYAFRNMLLNNGFVAVVRDSRGKDIHAACGQLRAASTPANGS
ncbi:MAG TPA: 23S rRNA (adenine(2503)-C(2))-methyltransferase RlmN [Nitrospiraceae bacterium]|nr:23S rRNA (adenine(2503)-C(2))-methyltransferase RlmN [Nitrospiraceae bacterium]